MSSYLLSLEERVAYLELTLQKHGIQYDTLDATPRSAHTSPASAEAQASEPLASETEDRGAELEDVGLSVNEAAQSSLREIISLTERSSADEPAFSKILLAELAKSKARPQVARHGQPESAASTDRLSSDKINISDLLSSQVSLPSKQTAHHLVEAYFQFANPGLPLLHEPTFRCKLDHLYSKPSLVIDLMQHHSDAKSRLAIFFVFEVFAVALEIMQKRDPLKIPTSFSERYHTTALLALSEAGLPSDVEGVQALLLIAKYSYNHPTTWDAWKTVGIALRLAIELGLHRDPPREDLDALTLDTMRRVFWVAYSMDRSVAIALTMPLGIPDGAITAKVSTNASNFPPSCVSSACSWLNTVIESFAVS